MKSFSIRLLYLYLFSFVGLLISIIGFIRLTDLGMKVLFFPKADEYTYYTPTKLEPADTRTPEQIEQERKEEETRMKEDSARQRQRELSGAISMIVVGLPVYLYHWKTIQKENKKEKNS